MSRWLKYSWYAALAAIASGCAGSCSSCSSCGVTPLPGGFENAKRIDNAASVRITESGFDFLEDNLGSLAGSLLGDDTGGGGVISFEVPSSSQNLLPTVDIDVCPGGPDANANPPKCLFEADLTRANLNISSSAPHHIVVSGTIAARLQHLPVRVTALFIPSTPSIRLNSGASCNDAQRGNFANIPIDVRVSISTEKDPEHAARRGYSRVSIEQFSLNQDALSDSIAACGGGLTGPIINALKGFLMPQLVGPLIGNLTSTLDEQLCMSADPASGVTCPTGTTADGDGICRFTNGDCVGTALGIDGNIDLSGMLASLSPGTEGGLDFMLSVGGEGTRDDGSGMLWGDLNPVAGGATLGMMGGAEPRPLTTCVPIVPSALPTGIPIPDELTSNTISGWTGDGPHLGIALSERFINHALAGAYNSGALCLGIGGETLGGMLTSDTLGLLIPSLKELARQQRTAPLAIVLRPQAPPLATVGNGSSLADDPVLRIGLPNLEIDFYLWSNDRFIRAFSAQFDLDVPVNLEVDENSALVPVLEDIGVANPRLSNAPLIREDKDAAAQTLASLLASQIGGALGGAIDPIDLNDSLSDLGLSLKIPPTVEGVGSPGLRRLQKGSDGFLGIFAALAPAGAPYVHFSETEARVSSKQVDPAGLTLATANLDNIPRVIIDAKSSLDRGEQAIEYQYRLNQGYWRPWQQNSRLKVQDPSLRLQGRHQVEVRSRVVGEPTTVDRTPPVIEVLVDKSAPEVALKETDAGRVTISVYDVVSPASALEVRWQLDDGAFSAWTVAEGLEFIEVGQDARRLTVEVRDEEGNIGSQSQGLIRGRPDPTFASEGACDCSVPGATGAGRAPVGLVALGGILLFAGLRRRRRGEAAQPGTVSSAHQTTALADAAPLGIAKQRAKGRSTRHLAKVGLIAIAASFNGCSCSDTDDPGGNGGSGATGGTGGNGGSGGNPTCTNCETLAPGLVGAYASAVAAPDGAIWVAAYGDLGVIESPADGANTSLFGDLAVGRVADDGSVAWTAVDGLPAVDPSLPPGSLGGPPDPAFVDVNSYRGGLTDPGDDVGLWTSIQLGADGLPQVAYYDATNRALKFAQRDDQGAWTSHTVQVNARADIGRYAKLVLREGRPVIAFLAIEPGTGGRAQGIVRVASAQSALPRQGSDWVFADAAAGPAPCRKFICADGEECRAEDGVCATPLTTCDPNCGSKTKCYDLGSGPRCEDILDQRHVDTYPEASGLYIDLAVTGNGLGLIYYDRLRGDLYGVREEGGVWQTPVLFDGQGPGPSDSGDTGIGASLFIDSSGDWHVSYSDGITETVRYLKVTGGVTPGAPQVVDDGSTPDGRVVVGDDSSVWVNSNGTVFVSYQDATNGLLKLATHDGTGWQVRTLNVDGWVNGATQVLDVQGAPRVMAHWRKAAPHAHGSVAFIAP